MVTFVTLILSLVTGTLPIEVATDADTAEVEFLLDGVSVGVDRQPPWRLEVDFGRRLKPHELVAVARDADGHERGRARQLVNLPRSDAEVEVVLERDPNGDLEAARLVTVNSAFEKTFSVTAVLDGRLVDIDGDGRLRLDHLDPEAPHLLQVEAAFVDGTVARRELSFGGAWGREVRTALTAVPLIVDDRRNEPSKTRLASSIRSDGRSVDVAAVDRPGHRLFVVRDEASLRTLERHAWQLDQRFRRMIGWNRRIAIDDIAVPEPDPDSDLVFMVQPVPETVGSGVRQVELFRVTEAFDPPPGRGLAWLIGRLRLVGPGGHQRLAEAVAVSGVRAAGTRAPRAVLLVVSSKPHDPGLDRAVEVRRYLADLGVPLYVWATDGAAPAGWGEAADVSTAPLLRAAARRLERDLDRQWIAWLEGEHLPHRLELIESDEVRLAR